MSEIRGPKALEVWCRRITEGYSGVNVHNMTTSWRDGLAFCAMIHRFRPDLIDFESLNKDDVYGNNELAFRIAAQHLGIPALLDAEDMASCAVPDRLSILTYLSQFYQHFGGSSPSRVAVSRTPENASEGITPVAESPSSKVRERLGLRREPCVVCGMPVFLAEKLVIGRTIYHRICFRCARCHNQLTPGNYYETEDGEYCCETCPDEESTDITDSFVDSLVSSDNVTNIDNPPVSNYHRALSDEEKCVQQKNYNTDDLVVSKSTMEISQMRLNFMSSHLLVDDKKISESTDPVNNHPVSPDENCINMNKEPELKTSMTTLNDNDNCSNKFVYNIDDKTDNSIHNRCLTTTNRNIDYKNNDFKTSQDTKETLGVVVNDDNDKKVEIFEKEENVDQCLPLVKRRLKMFENLVIDESNNKDKLTSSTSSRFIEPDSLDVINCTETNSEESSVAFIQKDCDDDDGDVKLTDNAFNNDINILNATGINLSVEETNTYPDTMNPFNCEEDVEKVEDEVREKLKSSTTKVSTNPFGSDSEDEIDNEEARKNLKVTLPKPAARINQSYDCTSSNGARIEQSPKRVLAAPQINLNPFWSDGEEPDSEEESVNQVTPMTTPIPKPRTTKSTLETVHHLKTNLHRDGIHASNSSISSSTSTANSGSHYKKRKPAPPPPIPKDKSSTSITSSSPDVKSTLKIHDSSTVITPKPRKNKRAPPPPTSQSTPQQLFTMSNLSLNESPINEAQKIVDGDEQNEMWEDVKVNKNEANKNKQSQSISPEKDVDYSFHDKSTQGKWRRKKAPAPARPTYQRRKIKVMSAKDVKIELSEIELQQQGLEKQGVRLEQLIREKSESDVQTDENSLSADVDELVLELFALVNEKNELFRRQAELMLLKRQQRLEEEHADIEYQIRCLMCQPEATKTDFDKQREETLIQRLVDIVERRSEIVECLEMDRRREVEEDKSISMHMEIYTAKNKVGERASDTTATTTNQSMQSVKSKKFKLKEKFTEKHFKKSHKKDADKDVDETEVKFKTHAKRRWFY